MDIVNKSTREKYLDLEYLKANTVTIHAFGLGFIQIKLKDGKRVHVYTDRVRKTASEEEVHDHRYDFVSIVLKGTLTNDIYQVVPGDTHIMSDENCQPGVTPNSQKAPCSIKLLVSTTMAHGTRYFMQKDTLHKVEAHRAITLLTRESKDKELARVIRVKDTSLVCPFSVNMSEEILWEIVKKELEDAY